MKEKVRDFVTANALAAENKGAKTIAYCCAGCAHAAVSVVSGGGLDQGPGQNPGQAYILDTLLGVLRGKALRAPAGLRVAYFERCHSSYRGHFPDASLNWGWYRFFLDSVEGLAVHDVAGGRCARSRLRTSWARLKGMSYPELLARCLGATEGDL